MEKTITQSFLDRFDREKDTLSANSPSLLNQARQAAYDYLKENELPKTWSEKYKRFDIDTPLSGEWALNLTRKSYGVDPLRDYPCRLSYMATVQSFVLDDRIYKMSDEAPKAVFIGSLSDFESKHPNIAENYYNRMSSVQNDALSALNTLFVQDVLVVYLPKNVRAESPMHVINLSGIAPDTMTSPRFLVIAEENSHATLLFCDHAATENRSLRNSVIEIYAEAGATVECYDVEETGDNTIRLHNLHVHQEANSSVVVSSLTIHNGQTRNNFYSDLRGERASFVLSGLCILDGEQKADNYSIIRHSVPNCHSNELFKYSLNDRALGSFCGRIYVARDAQKTEAYQNNRNLLLSDTAKMYSKPQLEIYADDVKCSHGMTTGQLDTSALFYMCQRGVPYMEAKLMLTIAFMSDVLESIHLEPLRHRLEEVVDKRFRGLPATCGEHSCCGMKG
ncbi:Fe-S cluster assembly protein SufD [Porphyromonas sp.]|uniref:Fe-S cluster assembly protein SufD n=1 Tax=Porphyromonas sp. TaxID=1924944 RepID=UPI0026DA91F1|nr:Fe-S cluster assembly protein SufD [Porphyromonas sp.]MDO4695773.1 Fe-S cluster assembly protein SufD [Porphyromonas sp.]MDO4770670.1 Fe-S cluster assembly protein SufD [Porphyromonas sp.]